MRRDYGFREDLPFCLKHRVSRMFADTADRPNSVGTKKMKVVLDTNIFVFRAQIKQGSFACCHIAASLRSVPDCSERSLVCRISGCPDKTGTHERGKHGGGNSRVSALHLQHCLQAADFLSLVSMARRSQGRHGSGDCVCFAEPPHSHA